MDKEKETAKADEETSVPEKTTEEPEESSSEDTSTKEEIDYEAEIEAEKKRGVPDSKMAREAFKKREEKRAEDEEEDNEEEEDKPITRKEFEQALRKERQTAFKQVHADRIEELATQLAESEPEARYIVEIHKNRVWPESMSLREQMEEAWIIANKKRVLSKNKELARALSSRDSVSKNFASAHRDGTEGVSPRMASDDLAAYKRAGFEYDGKSRVWKKKLPNGKFLLKDPKTKRSWIG